MGRHGDRAREALLDAAEELFVRDGIDAVSSRRIAEAAGQANHSAVAYHFGGRDELIRAVLDRHLGAIGALRAEMAAGLAADADLHTCLSCLILPVTRHLESLPPPTRWARFVRQLSVTPSATGIPADLVAADPLSTTLIERTERLLRAIPPGVLAARQALLGRLVLDTCAGHEQRVRDGVSAPRWTALGHFLTDACAGMLAAPVTHSGDLGPL